MSNSGALVILLEIGLLCGGADGAASLGPVAFVGGGRGSLIAVVSENEKVLLLSRSDDVSRWYSVEVSASECIKGIVGGDAQEIMIQTIPEDDCNTPIGKLEAVTLDGHVSVLSPHVGWPCTFLDKNIGCQAVGSKVLVTMDRARTWQEVPLRADPFGIRSECWLSPTELLVQDDVGLNVVAFTQGKPSLRWSNELGCLPFFGPASINAFWFCGDSISVGSRQDGRELASTGPTGIHMLGMTSMPDRVYVWGFTETKGMPLEDGEKILASEGDRSLLECISLQGTGLRKGSPVHTERIAGVVLTSGESIIVFASGEVGRLASDGVQKVPIVVTEVGGHSAKSAMIPATQPATQPMPVFRGNIAAGMPTARDMEEEHYWLARVSPAQLAAVMNEVYQQTDLTAREYVLRVTEGCKRIASTQPDAGRTR